MLSSGQTHLNFLRTKITSLIHFGEFGELIQRHLGLKPYRRDPFERKSAHLRHVSDRLCLTKQFVNEPHSQKQN